MQRLRLSLIVVPAVNAPKLFLQAIPKINEAPTSLWPPTVLLDIPFDREKVMRHECSIPSRMMWTWRSIAGVVDPGGR